MLVLDLQGINESDRGELTVSTGYTYFVSAALSVEFVIQKSITPLIWEVGMVMFSLILKRILRNTWQLAKQHCFKVLNESAWGLWDLRQEMYEKRHCKHTMQYIPWSTQIHAFLLCLQC